mmetsp:Transcript_11847/g.40406  ORF Transcript_11847/g.40406 Transcript_11847/m.40406 type:complete len:217 (-) Transcript_11847:370-1020(-)
MPAPTTTGLIPCGPARLSGGGVAAMPRSLGSPGACSRASACSWDSGPEALWNIVPKRAVERSRLAPASAALAVCHPRAGPETSHPAGAKGSAAAARGLAGCAVGAPEGFASAASTQGAAGVCTAPFAAPSAGACEGACERASLPRARLTGVCMLSSLSGPGRLAPQGGTSSLRSITSPRASAARYLRARISSLSCSPTTSTSSSVSGWAAGVGAVV